MMIRAAAQFGNEALGGSVSTRASIVYDRLHQDILTGQLEPGFKLRLKDLIKQYGTGNSPIREALNRLWAKGMVLREENRGFSVPPAHEKELIEITKTRCWLEDLALRESIANGDEKWEERVVLAFHWLTQMANDEDSVKDDPHALSEWENHHRQYHLALISACDSTILIDYCADLHKRSFRYRNLAKVVEYRGQHELEEHRQLQRTVLARDADLAVELLKKHYRVTSEILLASGRFT